MPVTAISCLPYSDPKGLCGLWQKDEEMEVQKCLSNVLQFKVLPKKVIVKTVNNQRGADYCGLVAKACRTLCSRIDYCPPGSSVCGISQAGILQWVAMTSSRGSFRPRNRTLLSCVAGRFFTDWGKPYGADSKHKIDTSRSWPIRIHRAWLLTNQNRGHCKQPDAPPSPPGKGSFSVGPGLGLQSLCSWIHGTILAQHQTSQRWNLIAGFKPSCSLVTSFCSS